MIEDINQGHRLVQTGKISVADVGEHVIAKQNEKSHLNAFCRFDPDQIRRDCADIDRRLSQGEVLPMAGLLLAVKDCIDAKDLPTGDGTAALQDNIATSNNQLFQNMLDQGAVLAGKNNLHELGFGITSNNAFSGPVRNPHNPDMITGGSSGGTASAIGAGIVAGGLGTDTGGSCRIPAGLCGCYGYRPSMTRYEPGGAVAISHTRDTVGPLAGSMETLLAMDAVMSGDALSNMSEKTIGALRLGYDPVIHVAQADDEIRPTIHAALDRLAAAGATLVELDMREYMDNIKPITFPLVFFETKRELTPYLANIGLTPDDLTQGIQSPDVKAVFTGPVFGPEAPNQEDYDHIMNVLRPALIAQYTAFFDDHALDAMIFPTTPLPARPIGQDETVLLNGNEVPTFLTYIQNGDINTNVGGTGISIPIGFTEDRLPVGLEVDGRIDDDQNCLAVARCIDQVLNG